MKTNGVRQMVRLHGCVLRLFSFLGLAVLLALSNVTQTAAQTVNLRFDQERYVVRSGETFPVQVLITPPPAAGLFSFGVRLNFPATHAEVVGVASVRPVTALAGDGPRAMIPVIGTGPGFAAMKGTTDFFEASRPVSSGALLVTFLVHDLANGPYALTLDFFNTLGSTEQIFVDGDGSVLDAALFFGRAEVIPDGNLATAVNSGITFNRQTGLFEQTVRVTNDRPMTIPGVRLLVTDLPSGWRVWNAHGEADGRPFFLYGSPLPPAQHVDFRVEFRIPERNPTSQPAYLAEVFIPGDGPEPPAGTPFAVIPRTSLSDGTFLLEFTSLPGRAYAVQYSDDLVLWRTVAPTLTGNGTRLQWTDYGPPRTDRPPSEVPNRYYRVFLLP